MASTSAIPQFEAHKRATATSVRHASSSSSSHENATNSSLDPSEDRIYIGTGLELKLQNILENARNGMPLLKCLDKLESDYEITINFIEYGCGSAENFFLSLPTLVKAVKACNVPKRAEIEAEYGSIADDEMILFLNENISPEVWDKICHLEKADKNQFTYNLIHDEIRYNLVIMAKMRASNPDCKMVSISHFRLFYNKRRREKMLSGRYMPSIDGKSDEELCHIIESAANHLPIRMESAREFVLYEQVYPKWLRKFRNKSRSKERLEFLRDLATIDTQIDVANPLSTYIELDMTVATQMKFPFMVKTQFSTISYSHLLPKTHYLNGVIPSEPLFCKSFLLMDNALKQFAARGFFSEKNSLPAEWILLGVPVAIKGAKGEWIRGKIDAIPGGGNDPDMTIKGVDDGRQYERMKRKDIFLLPAALLKYACYELRFVLHGLRNELTPEMQSCEDVLLSFQDTVLDMVNRDDPGRGDGKPRCFPTDIMGINYRLNAWEVIIYVDDNLSGTVNENLVEMGLAQRKPPSPTMLAHLLDPTFVSQSPTGVTISDTKSISSEREHVSPISVNNLDNSKRSDILSAYGSSEASGNSIRAEHGKLIPRSLMVKRPAKSTASSEYKNQTKTNGKSPPSPQMNGVAESISSVANSPIDLLKARLPPPPRLPITHVCTTRMVDTAFHRFPQGSSTLP